MTQLDVEIWSDLACPWCYVGKRRLEAALAGFAHRDAVRVTWRSFELDPEAPRVRDPRPYAERLAEKYGSPIEEAEARLAEMVRTAAADGLVLRFDLARGGNTFDAHRLVHFAAARGLGDATQERLLRAYFTDGEAIGEPEVLLRLAGEVGLPLEETRAMLTGPDYGDAVRQDEAEAEAMGIRGVPCFIIARRYGISGAQTPEALRATLDKAWSTLVGA